MKALKILHIGGTTVYVQQTAEQLRKLHREYTKIQLSKGVKLSDIEFCWTDEVLLSGTELGRLISL